MIISPEGLAQLKAYEAFREFAYPDPESPLARATKKARWGFVPAEQIMATLPADIAALDPSPWTVGYGFTDGVNIDTRCSRADADVQLLERLVPYEHAVEDACTVVPTQAQMDALLCLTWNIGIGAFKKSSVLRLHNRRMFKEAANAFGLYNKSKGRVSAGLVARRAKESAMYLEDHEPDTPVPQVVDTPATMATSKINIAQGAAGITASIAAVQPVLDAINAFKTGVDGLGQWAVPAVLVGIVLLCGYTIWQRVQLRNRGQA